MSKTTPETFLSQVKGPPQGGGKPLPPPKKRKAYKSLGKRGLGNRLNRQAQELVDLATPAFLIISQTIDKKDEVYVNLTTQVVQIVLALVIKSSNASGTQTKMNIITGNTPYNHSVNTLIDIKNSSVYSEILAETRKSFENNYRILQQNKNNEYESTSAPIQNSGGGCYIATMVYKDYDHPQVMVLRNFRDNHLAEFFFGRAFIKFYYKYSPSWVLFLENKKTLNNIIRGALNQLIRLIKFI